VFQPYACLKKIVVFDPHKWYYHNQQDPRYALATVVRKMGEIYGAEVVFNAV
jgi:primosomal protein N'